MTIYGAIAAIVAPSTVTSFGDFGSVNRSQQASQAQLRHQLSNFGHEAAGLAVAYLLLFVASQVLTGVLTAGRNGPRPQRSRSGAGPSWWTPRPYGCRPPWPTPTWPGRRPGGCDDQAGTVRS